MSEAASEHNGDVTALLAALHKDIDAIVEQVESLARLDVRAATRARDTLSRSCEAMGQRLKDAEARVSPSRWFG